MTASTDWFDRVIGAAPVLDPGQSGTVFMDDDGRCWPGSAYATRDIAWRQVSRVVNADEAARGYVVLAPRTRPTMRILLGGPDFVLRTVDLTEADR